MRASDASDEWHEFFKNLEFVKNLETVQQSLIEKNKAMANENIAKSEQLTEMYNMNKELNTKLHEELRKKTEELTRMKSEIEQRYSPMALLKLLREKIREAEDESDELAAEFLQNGGDASVDEFLKTFMEKRALMHLRLAKKDRFEKRYIHSASRR